MVSSSLNNGYNFITKALQSSDPFVSFTEFKKILTCLAIPMTLDDEAEFREYLISKELVRVERNDMLFDVDVKIDMIGLTKMLKQKILKLDPKANFDELQHFPEDAKTLLNTIKHELLESCLEDFQKRARVYADKDLYVPEVKIKEIFHEIFPYFSGKKFEQFLGLQESKRKASKYNYYQDSFSIKEIMVKIRKGEDYREADLSEFKSTLRVQIAREKKEKQAIDQFNGELLGYGNTVFRKTER